MLARTTFVALALAVAPAAANEPLPKAFADAAIGIWTQIGTELDAPFEPMKLVEGMARCRAKDPTRIAGAFLIAKRDKHLVQVDLGSGTVIAIAAAKAGPKRGRLTGWAVATSAGYEMLAFAVAERSLNIPNAKTTPPRLMLKEDGIYLHCRAVPEAVVARLGSLTKKNTKVATPKATREAESASTSNSKAGLAPAPATPAEGVSPQEQPGIALRGPLLLTPQQ